MSDSIIKWTDQLSVQINAIDNQHKNLVDIINKLYGKMKEGKGKDVIGQIIDELISYTKTHFTFEENMMKEHDYPQYNNHVEEHKVLVEQVYDMKAQYNSGKILSTAELMSFLEEWFTGHIKGTDMKYKPFLNEKGVS
ncbi:MAG: bacteriohemerythrin [Spirochaetota bacterium]|nr:bacteriohemerythrin [Spirochaetota bacterium]